MALLAQAAVFWVLVGLLRSAPVQAVAWVLLYGVAVAAAVTASRTGLRWWPARRWLALAGYSLLLSAMFWGADQGLDALHGSHRAKVDVAGHLGGLELWLVLCPGAFSVAVAGCARAGARR